VGGPYGGDPTDGDYPYTLQVDWVRVHKAQQCDAAGAKAAYLRVVKEFGYAQCWDPRGWFWKPADAARQKIVELEFDAE
jgi:hypothetical protein